MIAKRQVAKNGQVWLTYPAAAANDPDHDYPCHTVSRSLSEARRDATEAGYQCAIFTGPIVDGAMNSELFVEVWPPTEGTK